MRASLLSVLGGRNLSSQEKERVMNRRQFLREKGRVAAVSFGGWVVKREVRSVAMHVLRDILQKEKPADTPKTESPPQMSTIDGTFLPNITKQECEGDGEMCTMRVAEMAHDLGREVHETLRSYGDQKPPVKDALARLTSRSSFARLTEIPSLHQSLQQGHIGAVFKGINDVLSKTGERLTREDGKVNLWQTRGWRKVSVKHEEYGSEAPLVDLHTPMFPTQESILALYDHRDRVISMRPDAFREQMEGLELLRENAPELYRRIVEGKSNRLLQNAEYNGGIDHEGVHSFVHRVFPRIAAKARNDEFFTMPIKDTIEDFKIEGEVTLAQLDECAAIGIELAYAPEVSLQNVFNYLITTSETNYVPYQFASKCLARGLAQASGIDPSVRKELLESLENDGLPYYETAKNVLSDPAITPQVLASIGTEMWRVAYTTLKRAESSVALAA